MSSGELADVPYDYAAIAPAGSTLFTAGACPLDSDGQVVEPGDHKAQAHRVLDNLLRVLADNGARPEDLVPFGGELAHKAFALAVGLELLVSALAGPHHSAVLLVARPEHDVVPGFRALAAGVRLPGDA